MVKSINSLKNGTVIGLDANIFLYVTTTNPKYQMTCKNLLNRVYRGELIGITSVIILDEVLYKTMIFEVMERYMIGWRSAVETVKTEPEVMRDLKKPKEILDAIIRIGIEIIPFDLNLIVSAEAICRRYLLRSHDAILVATLEESDFLPAASNGASCFNHEGFMSTGVNSTQSVPTYRCFSSCSCDFTRDRAIRSRDQASLPNERSDSNDGIIFKSYGAGFIPATSNGVFSRGDYKVFNVATNDSDFERVDFLNVWKP